METKFVIVGIAVTATLGTLSKLHLKLRLLFFLVSSLYDQFVFSFLVGLVIGGLIGHFATRSQIQDTQAGPTAADSQKHNQNRQFLLDTISAEKIEETIKRVENLLIVKQLFTYS